MARIFQFDLPDDKLAFGFQPGMSSGVRVGGREIQRNQIVQHSLGRSYYQASQGPSAFAGLFVSLPMVETMREVFGRAGRSLKETHLFIPTAAAMQRLMRLHWNALRLVHDLPELARDSQTVRGLEQSLIDALACCLNEGAIDDVTLAQRNHASIMRRFSDALAVASATPVFLTEICAQIGVSERTLRVCCEKHIGMGPKRFLGLRRLHLARAKLLEGMIGETNVTQVATEFGFWELGRFAGIYQDLFGELPSATLARTHPDGEIAAANRFGWAQPRAERDLRLRPMLQESLGWAQGAEFLAGAPA